MLDSVLEKLKFYENPAFKFDPKKHRYTFNGKQFISVATYISKFHKPFDDQYWSKRKSEETGVPQAQILKEWKQNNDNSNYIGTATHNWIENYFNKVYQELPSDIRIIERINKFNTIYAKHLHKLTPIKFEIRIFSEKLGIAGTIDSLFMYKGEVIIFDWKTNKKFTHDDQIDGTHEFLLPPFNEHFKNHLNEYSIQVSLYKLMLREVGINIKKCYLLHIGPDLEPKIYTAKDFSDILEKHILGD